MVGGTSAGAPQWAALLAIADQGRTLSGQPSINGASPQEVMSTLYASPGDLHDIVSGTSTGSTHYTAGPGYDLVTGLGTPMADLVVGSFDGTPSTPVPPAAPTGLAAAAVSTTQINLSWTSSAGATGYLIQRSPNGSSGWTQIASTSGNTTSYADTGLVPGTTFYYRVFATSGNAVSAASNVASATTNTPPAPSTGDTLWSNSFVPSENAYSSGSYELGVKLRSDVPGVVTGIRFYKQPWMSGFAHAGHLWSSSGALLATAAFTAETASGWQQVNLSRPVAIAANTVYIVSFSTGGGYFGVSTNFFSKSGVDSGPLHALANGVSGGDGVYGARSGSFPGSSGSGMNFWADVAFTPAPVGAPAPASLSGPSSVVVGPAGSVPSGPARHASGARRTTGATHSRPAVRMGSWPAARYASRAWTMASWHRNGALPSAAATV
jgi:hypothetical protein